MKYIHLARWSPAALAAVFLLLNPAVSRADYRSDTIARYDSTIAESAKVLAESQAALLDVPGEEWTEEALEMHLHNAMYSVYLGLIYFEYLNRELPSDITTLAETKYVPSWPTNPLDGFEPVQVLSLDDEFAPGSLVLQVCPPEFWSVMSDPRPLSFELAVLGPEIDCVPAEVVAPMELNSWAEVPEGALYMVGSHTETAISVRLKYEQLLLEVEERQPDE